MCSSLPLLHSLVEGPTQILLVSIPRSPLLYDKGKDGARVPKGLGGFTKDMDAEALPGALLPAQSPELTSYLAPCFKNFLNKKELRG